MQCNNRRFRECFYKGVTATIMLVEVLQKGQ